MEELHTSKNNNLEEVTSDYGSISNSSDNMEDYLDLEKTLKQNRGQEDEEGEQVVFYLMNVDDHDQDGEEHSTCILVEGIFIPEDETGDTQEVGGSSINEEQDLDVGAEEVVETSEDSSFEENPILLTQVERKSHSHNRSRRTRYCKEQRYDDENITWILLVGSDSDLMLCNPFQIDTTL